MYAAVRRYEGVTDPQKVAQLGEEGFVPIISEMPGFVAHYLVDAGDGVMVATSVFEHKDAEEQSTFRAGEFIAEHLAPLLPNPPQSQPVRLSHTRRSSRRVTESSRARCVRAGAPESPGFVFALIHRSRTKIDVSQKQEEACS